jgi:hypothetical protein
MKWYIFLLIFSVSMLSFWAFAGFALSSAASEAIAEKLAPRIGVNEDILRDNLFYILIRGGFRRAVDFGTPWAIMSILLTVRILADVVKKQRNRAYSDLNGKRIIKA